MDSLIKQTRAKFAGARQENKESTQDRKIQPQKTQTFTEKQRSQSWIRRQFSRQMSWDNDFSSVDYAAAVAAATFAIQSLEESKIRDQKETTYGPDKSLNKMKSKAEDAQILPEQHRSGLKFSDETPKKSFKDPDIKMPISSSTSKRIPEKTPDPESSIEKKMSYADADKNTSNKSGKPAPEKAAERAPSLGRPSTFADKHLESKKPETPVPKPDPAPRMGRPPTFADKHLDSKKPETQVPKPDHPPNGRPTTQPVETRRRSATKPGPGDSMADAWEKEKMARAQERYGRLRATIDNWEAKKKHKASLKLERTQAKLEKKRAEVLKSDKRARTEAELEKKRAKAVKRYRSDIRRIEEIAAGARAQAEENRRNNEFKVKEKANKIRLTGELPPKCLCF